MNDAITGAWTWLTTSAHWQGEKGVLHRLAEHLYFTGVCLAVACVVALPIALLLGHLGRGGALAINISNVGRAVPTLAVLVLLTITPLGEYGDLPTLIALVLFAIPPLLTNAYIGMREVDTSVVEAARGMGMSGKQVFSRVELPLAYPLIMTGIRTSAVQVVATATLAAMAGEGGLGRIITAGFNLQNTPQVVAGAVIVAVLALLIEVVLVVAGKVFDPMRRRASRTAHADSAPTDGPDEGAGTPTGAADVVTAGGRGSAALGS
ncbi:ABC transporter permease [Streptomyces tsukubensis]|uniref:ABC transporter permease n=1 Tax=Streptomyces tsukubensis TaxID=83656 RepID=A0A1V4A5F5_9ACTN|nr:ABC transporter permease [Streptomyces tsukubensis]OON75564.1 ABC transporter permease [Streptomyces tsukubensis]QFR95052.1 ABC transporter permease subunit [Streptomyces tsukubensis]